MQSDEQVDALELEIDKQCVDLLALRQPLAIDLRFITSSIKITNNLERIGRSRRQHCGTCDSPQPGATTETAH